MRADDVYAILKGKLVKLTEEIKTMGDWKPIRHQGTVQTADDLPADAKEGWMYNIATDSIYGAAGMNVVMTSEGWDSMGPIINMALYLTKEEAGKSYQPKGNYLSGTDSTLTELGKAADAKETGDKFSKTSADLEEKLDKNQGSENSGKIAGINESGDIVPMFPVGVEYNEETNCLEFGSDQGMKLNQGIGLDSTLTKTGFAADAGVTGKEINSLKEDMSNKITKFYASNQGETHLADSDNGKIMDMMLYGKSEQKRYSGKNLLNYDAWKDTLIVRGTAIYENNGITLAATRNDCYTEMDLGTGFPDNAKIEVSEGETLTLSWEEIENKSGYIYIFGNGIASNGIYVNNRGSKKLSYTVPSGITFITFRFGVDTAGDTISYKNIQIEKGSTATSYEPYVGGQPSPSPDYPQEIKSVVNPTVKVCGKNLAGLWKQGLLSTDDGKKIIANNYWVNTKEYVKISVNNYAFSSDSTCRALIYEYDRDKKYIGAMQLLTGVKSTIYVPNSKCAYIKFGYNYDGSKEAITPDEMGAKHWLQLELGSTATPYEPYHEQTVTLPYTLNAIPVESGGNVTIDGQQYIADYVDVERGKLVRMVDSSKLDNTQSIIGKIEWLLAEPQEIDLTQEEVQALKALATYYPTTNISVNSKQLDGYTVFNYPISMANGWNYVKKQLNDNRDYIYDMDIQSAEAYVNSEYAVALTELEV